MSVTNASRFSGASRSQAFERIYGRTDDSGVAASGLHDVDVSCGLGHHDAIDGLERPCRPYRPCLGDTASDHDACRVEHVDEASDGISEVLGGIVEDLRGEWIALLRAASDHGGIDPLEGASLVQHARGCASHERFAGTFCNGGTRGERFEAARMTEIATGTTSLNDHVTELAGEPECAAQDLSPDHDSPTHTAAHGQVYERIVSTTGTESSLTQCGQVAVVLHECRQTDRLDKTEAERYANPPRQIGSVVDNAFVRIDGAGSCDTQDTRPGTGRMTTNRFNRTHDRAYHPFGTRRSGRVVSLQGQDLALGCHQRGSTLRGSEIHRQGHVRCAAHVRWQRSMRRCEGHLDSGPGRAHTALVRPEELDAITERMVHARTLIGLLDYDGTLVPFAPRPELAAPDQEICELLRSLASAPETKVHIVSGRTRHVLETWFGELELGLHAEHGLWSRLDRDLPWLRNVPGDDAWLDLVRPVVLRYVQTTPGSLVEYKTAGMAWHHRCVDSTLARERADALVSELETMSRDGPFEVLLGERVVEVRPRGSGKGLAVRAALKSSPNGSLVVAMGDDRTDEDMFAAVPADAITVRAGALAGSPSIARHHVEGPEHVRALLRAVMAGRHLGADRRRV